MDPYFDLNKLKVGDRLWSFARGWGFISDIDLSSNSPIKVKFDKDPKCEVGHRDTGQEEEELNQELFYDEIKFTPPPRTKRLVKKTVEGWVNVYDSYCGQSFCRNKDIADRKQDPGRISCVHLTGEYEVEE